MRYGYNGIIPKVAAVVNIADPDLPFIKKTVMIEFLEFYPRYNISS